MRGFQASFENIDGMSSVKTISYPLLPCKIGSKGWKTKTCRSILSRMPLSSGYSKSGHALGTGEAPHGWPQEVIAWESFTGASRSGLSTQQITTIIRCLFQAMQIDPDEYVQDVSEEDFNIVEQNVK